jgi:prepilin-type N-terminal cleavage/methylation domain-containing protein
MLIKNTNKQQGFTLIEIAVVLVIAGFLLGSFIGSLTQRIETTRRDKTIKQLEDIKLAILGFASASGRIPCPATTTATAAELGLEQPVGGGVCTLQHGFVPGRTLGLNGSYNMDNLLTDSWGNPIRYSVTTSNLSAFTTQYTMPGAGGIKDITMAALNPNLIICNGNSTSGSDCSGGPDKLIETAPFVVLSLGKDGSNFVTTVAPNTDQGENASEEAVVANATGENLAYTVGKDRVFVSKSYSSVDSMAGLFDDLIVWESPYVLYSRMMEAGQLP